MYLRHFAAENIETWCWLIGNTLMAIKKLVPMATHSFSVPFSMISIFLVIFQLHVEKHITRPQTQPNIFI